MSAPGAAIPSQTPNKPVPDHARLARHLLRRLRRSLEKDAVNRAIEAEILIESVSQVGGVDMRKLTLHPHIVRSSRSEIELVMRRFASSRILGAAARRSGDGEENEFIYRIERNDSHRASKHRNRAATQKPTASQLDTARHERLTARLLREVRRAADRPQAADVATMLLLARSANESGETPAKILQELRAPRPIVSIVAAVAGFERCFLNLLRQGLILPGTVGLINGHDLASGHTIRFDSRTPTRWQVIVFAGSRHDAEDLDRINKLVDRAALADLPILIVAENHQLLPERLEKASQLRPRTVALDAELVRSVIAEVLGRVPQLVPSDASCARLTLPDLAIAIRPGVSPDRAVEVLERIAGSRTIFGGAPSETAGSVAGHKSPSADKNTNKTGRGNPGSGSEIIQPDVLTGTDSDRFIPRVETLSGYGDATRWALSLKADLELWRTGALPWEEMSARLLLAGPPGTGKTTFAKALSNSLQVPLIATSVATWMEPGYFGDVLKRMKAAFAEAEALKPSILFVDELDGIGTRRQHGEWAEYTNWVINRALELLDGAARSTGVIVVAATNRPEMIDPALLRSGRLEKHIAIPPPDTDALVGILRHHLKHDLDAVVATARAPQGTPSMMSEIANSVTEGMR